LSGIKLAIREQFEPLVLPRARFGVAVAHRRAGKTVAAIQRLILAALQCDKPRPRLAYIASTYGQAKRVAWDYLVDMARPALGAEPHQTELRVDLLNGARITLFGADNADTLRGSYFDDVVLDEYADMRPSVWPAVVRPALADRGGSALFIGTPKGRNDFWRIWDEARGGEWSRLMLKASASGLLGAAELAEARRTMSAELYAQEFECSFDSAVVGSVYGSLLDQAITEGRVGRVDVDPALPVDTSWDLGVADATCIWFTQEIRGEIRVVDYYEASGEGLAHFGQVLKDRGYRYGRHIGPHDIAVRELGTGRSRIETARDHGIRFEIAANIPIEDGIEAVRMILPRCWFDADRCQQGLEALRMYRREWDERNKVLRPRPVHDWTSHAADAFRMRAVAHKARATPKPMPSPNMRGAWLA